MTEFAVEFVAGGSGLVIGSFITAKVLAFKTRKKRHAREHALREIASHQWHTDEQNDALVITRIALQGLDGE